MTPGKIWPDSLGQHPYARDSWIGQAIWRTFDPQNIYMDEDGEPAVFPELRVLALSVPPSMHWLTCRQGPLRAFASFLPWRDSGIGIVALAASDAGTNEVVIAVNDLAGRTDTHDLRLAAAESRVGIAACTELEPEVCPIHPIVGLADALAEAGSYRRLAARELTEAVEDVRWTLRSPAVFPMAGLGLSGMDLRSITLNVTLPL